VTIIALLDAQLPAAIAEADQCITVSVADPPLAAALDCAAGDGLLRIDRLYSEHSYRIKLRRDRHA
jgi:GntR family transcriptional regulator